MIIVKVKIQTEHQSVKVHAAAVDQSPIALAVEFAECAAPAPKHFSRRKLKLPPRKMLERFADSSYFVIRVVPYIFPLDNWFCLYMRKY